MGKSTPNWVYQTTSMEEMQRRHEERMKERAKHDEERDLVDPKELLERIWNR